MMFDQLPSKFKQRDKSLRLKEACSALASGNFVLIINDLSEKKERNLLLSAEKLTLHSLSLLKKHTPDKIILTLFGKEVKEINLGSPQNTLKEIKFFLKSQVSQKGFATPFQIFHSPQRDKKILTYSLELAKRGNLVPAFLLSKFKNNTFLKEIKKDFEKPPLPIPSIFLSALKESYQQKNVLVRQISQATIPTKFEIFQAYVFESLLDGVHHLVLSLGNVKGKRKILVRIHSECLTGDVFSSKRCDCAEQRDLSLKKIAKEGKGIFIYLKGHEGRGIGIGNKIEAYKLQEKGLDTVDANLSLGFPADARKYNIAAEILSYLDVNSIRLMTNNPAKCRELEDYHLKIVERIPLMTKLTPHNIHYLKTKKEKLGHFLEI